MESKDGNSFLYWVIVIIVFGAGGFLLYIWGVFQVMALWEFRWAVLFLIVFMVVIPLIFGLFNKKDKK